MTRIAGKAGPAAAVAVAAALCALLAAPAGAQSSTAPAAPAQPAPAPPATTPAPQQAPAQPVPMAPERPNGSLWGSGSRNLASDLRAVRVGDVITILVQENATASSSANTQTSRADSGGFLGTTGLLYGFVRPFGAGANLSTNGSGQTNRSGSLVTQLTAIVKQVLPNGNLLVEGTRVVGVNKEQQKIVISGTVRPQDIGPNNTVSSISLANATVQYDGKGTVGDMQHKGLLSKLFGWLF